VEKRGGRGEEGRNEKKKYKRNKKGSVLVVIDANFEPLQSRQRVTIGVPCPFNLILFANQIIMIMATEQDTTLLEVALDKTHIEIHPPVTPHMDADGTMGNNDASDKDTVTAIIADFQQFMSSQDNRSKTFFSRLSSTRKIHRLSDFFLKGDFFKHTVAMEMLVCASVWRPNCGQDFGQALVKWISEIPRRNLTVNVVVGMANVTDSMTRTGYVVLCFLGSSPIYHGHCIFILFSFCSHLSLLQRQGHLVTISTSAF
jgi:hypothetical protein